MAVNVSVCLGATKRARTLSFDAPRVVIGRGVGCDVRLPDRSVSQHHATIRRERDHYVVVDEGSTNGTYLNGERLPSRGRRVLKRQTSLRTGRIQLDVEVEEASVRSTTVDETRALALEIVADAGWIETNSPPVVTATEGPDEGKTLTLEQRDHPYRMGRSPEADLELTDPDASRIHVELRCDGGGVWVRDCDSKNGTVLNGRPLPSGRALLWETKASVRIGETSFKLNDAAAEKLSEITQAPDETFSPAADDLTFAPRSGSDPSRTPTPAPGVAGTPAPAGARPKAETKAETETAGETTPSDDSASISASSPTDTAPPTRPSQKRRIPWLDLSIVVLAILVLAASVVGIYWLFSGS